MQVSVREFKSHLSSYLQQASNGQPIEITKHRKIIARLQATSLEEQKGVEALLSDCSTWSGKKPKGAEIALTESEHSLSDLVLDMRK